MEELDKYFSEQYDTKIQYASIEAGIEAYAEDYSFNIESELFQQLTKEQQVLWRKEIEQACISGGYSGLNLAKDPRYKENLEVKEVNLEKLVNDYFTGWYFDSELDILAKPNNYSATIDDVKEIAKHFFELGLKTQHNNISILNIDNIFEKEGIDPNSKDAKILKECYYMALEKLKAQKEE